MAFGKERRISREINHIISKQLVESLCEGDCIVFENLKGIRQRAKLTRYKHRDFHSWSFAQLIDLSRYKFLQKGIPVVFVDARNSSKECSRCGYISKSSRRSQSLFRCIRCGFQHNADFNASLNLAKRAGSLALGYLSDSPKVSALSG